MNANQYARDIEIARVRRATAGDAAADAVRRNTARDAAAADLSRQLAYAARDAAS
jgi:hypothetical protein